MGSWPSCFLQCNTAAVSPVTFLRNETITNIAQTHQFLARVRFADSVSFVCQSAGTSTAAIRLAASALLRRKTLTALCIDYVDDRIPACGDLVCPFRTWMPTKEPIRALLTEVVIRVPLHVAQTAPLFVLPSLKFLQLVVADDGPHATGAMMMPVVCLPVLTHLNITVAATGLPLVHHVLRGAPHRMPLLDTLVLDMRRVRYNVWTEFHINLVRILSSSAVARLKFMYFSMRDSNIFSGYVNEHHDEFFWLLQSALTGVHELTIDLRRNDAPCHTMLSGERDGIPKTLIGAFMQRCAQLLLRAHRVSLLLYDGNVSSVDGTVIFTDIPVAMPRVDTGSPWTASLKPGDLAFMPVVCQQAP